MTNQNTSLDDFNHEQYNWTKTDDGNYTREKDTFNDGCDICGGTQIDDPDADWYCPHEDQQTHTEMIRIEEDTASFWKHRNCIDEYPATPENIKAALRDPWDATIGN